MGNARQDGSLLFRQLLRIFKGAYLEEYYKNGTWDMETLELDLELLQAHHKRCQLKAGAPDPPPLEDIPEVVLPEPVEVVPPWRKTASFLSRQATANGIKLNAAATAAGAGRGLKRPFASVSQAVETKRKAAQLAGKGIVVRPPGQGAQILGKGKGKVVPGKGAQRLGKGTRLFGEAIGKGEQPPGIISQLLAKSEEGSGKALGKGVQLPGKDEQLLVSKGTKPSGKALGKGGQLPGKDGQLLVSKGTKPAGTVIGKGPQLIGKGSKELAEGLKGSQKGVPGAPAFLKATQPLDKSSQKGKGKGKRVQYVKSGAVERFKALQGQNGSVPLSNSKAASLALANSKAGSPALTKAGSPAFTKAGSPAFSKAGPPNRPRIILSKFAKRAANRVTMSKEVKEKFLDADDLD